MASISFPPLLPPPAAEPLRVDAVAAALPAALVAEAETLPFSLPLGASVPAQPALPGAAGDPAALRPDQLIMARQLSYPAPDAAQLAQSWRATVRNYATQLASREQQARSGLVPAGLLAATEDGRIQRGIDAHNTIHPDAWRFTVHARGPQEQYLSMVTGDPDQQSGRRRRARAALRLELVLADGTRVTVQADPVPGGLSLTLCADDAAALERLRALQPALELAVGRAGLEVLRWNWRASLPASQLHARPPAPEAAGLLAPQVFRALAELALLLPGASALPG